MFEYIKGKLEIKMSDYIVIDINGIGYKIFMSDNSIEKVGDIGSIVKVYTYLKVREDDVSIFGFNTNEELKMFELLLSVSGIGAKSALIILSNITPSSFALAVITSDVEKLKKIPGIGAKTAQRIILELKDKLKTQKAIEQVEENVEEEVNIDEKIQEAVSALLVLGYNKKVIDKVLDNKELHLLSIEDIIKKCLHDLSR